MSSLLDLIEVMHCSGRPDGQCTSDSVLEKYSPHFLEMETVTDGEDRIFKNSCLGNNSVYGKGEMMTCDV